MKHLFLFTLSCVVFVSIVTAEKNSETLNDHTEITINRIDNVVLERSYSVNILNAYEEDLNNIKLYYDKDTKIKQVQVEVKPLKGKVKKYKKSDFQNWANDGFSVVQDGRILYLPIQQASYPYTITVNYTYEISGTMFFPRWIPQKNTHHYVKEATIKITDLASINLRFETFNMNPPIQIGNSYEATVNHLQPFEYEVFNQNRLDYYPSLYIIADSFSQHGYQGSMESWQSFGMFQESLNKDRNTLSADQLTEVKTLVQNKHTPLEKVQTVYDYLQDNSRYVSIQLGIGGWQPQETGFTHEKKYGDCKALSFYTKSLLEAVDIPSYYTVITAGKHKFYPISENVNPFANHAILTVPLEQDTVWLECTSQSNPFGFTGTFTSDRQALLVDGNNSKLIKTKRYTADDNSLLSKYHINLKEDGTLDVELHKKLSGIQLSESGLMHFDNLSTIEKENRMYDLNDIEHFKMAHFEVSKPSNEIVPEATVKVSGTVEKWFKANSKRVFFKLREYFAEADFSLPDVERKKPIYIQYPFTKTDTIQVTLPGNYTFENGVKTIQIDNEYGTYDLSQSENDSGQITIIRQFVLRKGSYPKESYGAMKEFADEVEQYDNSLLVFRLK